MASLNKMMVIGRLGTDPELRYTANGTPVTRFRLASGRGYTTADGERREETEWFTVVAWNQLAEQCNQYLTKGRLAYVEGRLHSNTWEGQDGKTHSSNEIVANQIIFLDRPSTGGPAEPGAEPGMDPGDLPF
ncbi:MAG: single-stranded DNA-binding protein [Dehalococcoidia bacterium]|nr:single-stranded DNA-binding protein [Dehalococcoidia bacterium]